MFAVPSQETERLPRVDSAVSHTMGLSQWEKNRADEKRRKHTLINRPEIGDFIS